MKHQSIQKILGAAAIACSILPAGAQERGNPEVRMIELIEAGDAKPTDIMKHVEEQMKQSNVDVTPEMRRQMMQSMRRAMNESPWPADRQADTPRMVPKGNPWMIGLMAEPVGDLLRTHLDLPKGSGMIISQVIDGSPAAKAGLVVSDILVSADDKKISDIGALKEAVQTAGKSGKPLKLNIVHEGKRRQVVLEPKGPKPKKERKAAQPSKRGEAVQAVRPGPEMLERQNRHIEEIRNQLRRINQQLERQQKQIEMLEKRLAEGNPRGPRPSLPSAPR